MATTTTYTISALTGPTSVNTTTAGNEYSSDIVTLPNGKSVVAYAQELSGTLFLRELTSGGVGTGVEATVAGSASIDPDHFAGLTVLNNGNVVVTWADFAATTVVHYRIYDQNLSPVTGVLNAPSFGQSENNPDVAALTGGGFVLTFERDASATDHDIFAQRYNADGTTNGGVIFVNDTAATLDNSPSVVGLTDGGFAIGHERATGANTAMWRSVWNANGTQRLADAVFDSTGTHNNHAQLTRLGAGFAVNYIDNGWTFANDDVTQWRFDANGATLATAYARGSSSAGNDEQLHAAVSSDGYSILAFDDGASDINGALIDPSGTPYDMNAVLDGSGGFQNFPAVSWIDRSHFAMIETVSSLAPGNDGNSDGVAARTFEVRRVVTGDGANDTITLTSDGIINYVDGGAGNDVIVTGSANDHLTGGAGNDTLDGGAGADVMAGGVGDDFYVVDNVGDVVTENANAGTDTVSSALNYTLGDNVENFSSFVSVNAQTVVGNALDNLIQMGAHSNILYGLGGNDYIVAGPAGSLIDGGDGNDSLYGGAGVDYMVGGSGDDILVGLGGQDSLYGGDGNDYIVAGDGPGAVVDGGAGANTLWGASGNDYIVGGEGADLMVGGAGSDYFFGNAGNDTLYGGQGTDYIYGNSGNDFIWTDDVGLPQASDYVYVGGGTGVDTIADFTPGDGANHDVLVISPASGLGSFADVQSHMAQVGVYTVVSMSGGDQVWLYNVQPFQLTANDFLFF